MILNESSLARMEEEGAVVAVPASVGALARSNEKELLALLAGAIGKPCRLEVAEGEPAPGAAAPAPAQPIDQHPVVKHAMEVFGGRVISVQARRG